MTMSFLPTTRWAILGWISLTACNESWAEPPLQIADFATVEALAAEAQSRWEELQAVLANEEAYAANPKRSQQLASMLAVAAQALADHEQASPLQPFAPDVRDVALKLAAATTFAEAAAGLPAVQVAMEGGSAKTAARDADWATLVKQRPIMEEMEVRMMQLQRALRRPKDLVKDSRHATAVAVANLTTLVDTHEVKNKEKLSEWDRLSRLMLEQMKSTATAMKQNQAAEAQTHFKAARATCVECHRQFKKEN